MDILQMIMEEDQAMTMEEDQTMIMEEDLREMIVEEDTREAIVEEEETLEVDAEDIKILGIFCTYHSI